MDRSGITGWLAAARRRARGADSIGLPRQQRAHLAALLTLLLALAAPAGAQKIEFDPDITQEEFDQFAALVGQAIYMSPVQPAGSASILRFDVGLAATGVPIDENAGYWRKAVQDEFAIAGHMATPRLVVSKGFTFFTIAGSYGWVPETDMHVWGGSLDVPIIDGGLVKPTLALRGSYSILQGTDIYEHKTYGAELFLGKGFGPLTPYGAIGMMRSDASGTITDNLSYESQKDMTRVTLGLRISFGLIKLVTEGVQTDDWCYSVKLSAGL